MATSLLIVGASARGAAFSARRAGFVPCAVDLFADADLTAICPAWKVDDYPAGLLAASIAAPASPWIYTGALENYPLLVDDLASRRPLWGNRADVLYHVRDPLELADVLQRHALATPDVSASPPDKDAAGTWLRKPRRSSSGANITLWHGDQDEPPAGYYYQRFVEGTPCAALFVAGQGSATLLGVTRQLCGAEWTGAAAFHYSGSIGPLPLKPQTLADVERLGSVLSREFGLVGLFGVDGILAGDQFWAVEVNPRYTASVEVVEWAYEFAALALHQQACEGKSLQHQPCAAQRSVGKAILFAREEIAPRDALWQETFLAQCELPWPAVADIPAPQTTIHRGCPIMTLFAEAASIEAVEEQLMRLASEWEDRLYG